MVRESLSIIAGVVLDEQSALSLEELARACAVQTEWVLALVEEGIIEPAAGDPDAWLFPGTSLARARIAAHLHRDLEIDLAGIALVLDLMEEIEALRARLRLIGE
ncbi:MAG: chaperone modulator CbpM [Gammaproteobacteria bacterium]